MFEKNSSTSKTYFASHASGVVESEGTQRNSDCSHLFRLIPKDPEEQPFFHQLFEQRVLENPKKIALQMGNNTPLSYEELNKQANRLAHYLITNDLKVETPVALVMSKSYEWIIAFLGVIKAGGTAVLMGDANQSINAARDVRHCLSELKKYCGRVNKKLFIIAHHCFRLKLKHWDCLFSDSVVCHFIEKLAIACAAEQDENLALSYSRLTHDKHVYIAFSSGSTSDKKGVLIPHSGLYSRLYACHHQLKLNPNDVMGQFCPPEVDAAILEIITALSNGMPLNLIPTDVKNNHAALCDYIIKHKISFITFTPGILQAIAKHKVARKLIRSDSLRIIITTGQDVGIELLNLWYQQGRLLVNGYGPAEATIETLMHIYQPDDQAVVVGSEQDGVILRLVDGRIGDLIDLLETAECFDEYEEMVKKLKEVIDVPNDCDLNSPDCKQALLKLLEDKREAQLLGRSSCQEGELYISGLGIGTGYINHEEKTKTAFLKYGEHTFYRTRDKFISTNYGLKFMGRYNDEIKKNGKKINLGELAERIKALAIGNALCKMMTEVVVITGEKIKRAVGRIDLDDLDLCVGLSIGSIDNNINAQELIGKLSELLADNVDDHEMPNRWVIIRNISEDFLDWKNALTKQVIKQFKRYGQPGVYTARGSTANENKEFSAENQSAKEYGLSLEVLSEEMINKLIDIWLQVLNQPKGEIEPMPTDDFKRLGGSSMVMQILLHRLVHETIFKGAFYPFPWEGFNKQPTLKFLIKHLAGINDYRPEAIFLQEDISSFEKPPIIFVHALLGSAERDYAELAPYVTDHPVIMISSGDFDSATDLPRSLEELAKLYIKQIRKKQPKEPYLLIGWSFGGILAYEISRQLRSSGELVSVILIDSMAPKEHIQITIEENNKRMLQLVKITWAYIIDSDLEDDVLDEFNKINYKYDALGLCFEEQLHDAFDNLHMCLQRDNSALLSNLSLNQAEKVLHLAQYHATLLMRYGKNVTHSQLHHDDYLITAQDQLIDIEGSQLGWEIKNVGKQLTRLQSGDHFTILLGSGDGSELNACLLNENGLIRKVHNKMKLILEVQPLKHHLFNEYAAYPIVSPANETTIEVLRSFKSGMTTQMAGTISIDAPPGYPITDFFKKLAQLWATGEIWQGLFDIVLYLPVNTKSLESLSAQIDAGNEIHIEQLFTIPSCYTAITSNTQKCKNALLKLIEQQPDSLCVLIDGINSNKNSSIIKYLLQNLKAIKTHTVIASQSMSPELTPLLTKPVVPIVLSTPNIQQQSYHSLLKKTTHILENMLFDQSYLKCKMNFFINLRELCATVAAYSYTETPEKIRDEIELLKKISNAVYFMEDIPEIMSCMALSEFNFTMSINPGFYENWLSCYKTIPIRVLLRLLPAHKMANAVVRLLESSRNVESITGLLVELVCETPLQTTPPEIIKEALNEILKSCNSNAEIWMKMGYPRLAEAITTVYCETYSDLELLYEISHISLKPQLRYLLLKPYIYFIINKNNESLNDVNIHGTLTKLKKIFAEYDGLTPPCIYLPFGLSSHHGTNPSLATLLWHTFIIKNEFMDIVNIRPEIIRCIFEWTHDQSTLVNIIGKTVLADCLRSEVGYKLYDSLLSYYSANFYAEFSNIITSDMQRAHHIRAIINWTYEQLHEAFPTITAGKLFRIREALLGLRTVILEEKLAPLRKCFFNLVARSPADLLRLLKQKVELTKSSLLFESNILDLCLQISEYGLFSKSLRELLGFIPDLNINDNYLYLDKGTNPSPPSLPKEYPDALRFQVLIAIACPYGPEYRDNWFRNFFRLPMDDFYHWHCSYNDHKLLPYTIDYSEQVLAACPTEDHEGVIQQFLRNLALDLPFRSLTKIIEALMTASPLHTLGITINLLRNLSINLLQDFSKSEIDFFIRELNAVFWKVNEKQWLHYSSEQKEVLAHYIGSKSLYYELWDSFEDPDELLVAIIFRLELFFKLSPNESDPLNRWAELLVNDLNGYGGCTHKCCHEQIVLCKSGLYSRACQQLIEIPELKSSKCMTHISALKNAIHQWQTKHYRISYRVFARLYDKTAWREAEPDHENNTAAIPEQTETQSAITTSETQANSIATALTSAGHFNHTENPTDTDTLSLDHELELSDTLESESHIDTTQLS